MTESKFVCFYEDYWNCKLPIHNSNQSTIIAMGIEYGPFDKNDLFRPAKLPEGWSIKDGDSHWKYIIDENNRKRIKINMNTNKPNLFPETRFAIRYIFGSKHIDAVVIDKDVDIGTEPKVVFRKRGVLPDQGRYPRIWKQKKSDFENQKYPEKWLEQNFSHWNDHSKYWGEGEVTVCKETGKIILLNNNL